MRFPFYRQLDAVDCGPTCIKMVAAHYGRVFKVQSIKQDCNITRLGVTPGDLIDGCKGIGIHAATVQANRDELQRMPLPAILFWRQEHYVVLYRITHKNGSAIYHVADPMHGRVKLSESLFMESWKGDDRYGIAIVAEPTDDFYTRESQKTTIRSEVKRFWGIITDSLRVYRGRFSWVIALSLLAVIANWFTPIIFQKTVDQGIMQKDMNLVLLLILGQFMFFVGYTVSGAISNVIQTKIGFNIGIELLSKYLHKLIKLPVSFFDTKLNTDLIQRISDQDRVQGFLTYTLNTILLTALNLIVFSGILCYYNAIVFSIFIGFMVIATLYAKLFLARRGMLDYMLFSVQSNDKNNIYEMVSGMKDIKINSAQDSRVAKWETTQRAINGIRLKSLFLNFYMGSGSQFLNRLKDIAITAGCAYYVIEGKMTIGVMMTIIFILGQLSSYASQIIDFFSTLQDTKLSLDRLDEIFQRPDEDNSSKLAPPPVIHTGIQLQGVSFKYPGSFSRYVINDLTVCIPKGKITAIVGASGSGKTTLLKLLLSFYYPQQGEVLLDDTKMCDLEADKWRQRCGVVMQDGYIFSGTIAENIAIADQTPDLTQVRKAAAIACIDTFIDSLPMGYNSKIGGTGIDLSGGQKQRIFIARAVYKDPDFIFFDEATSSLDANNERDIMQNLDSFYQGKTVVIVAHRLSTVSAADNIIFLDNGRIIEQGTHQELSRSKGAYYNLVKNQLELGI